MRTSFRHLLTRLLAPAAAVLLVGAAPASALVPMEPVVPSGSSVTVPSGAVITPDGELWVADGEEGICRIRALPPGLVSDPVWCPVSGTGLKAIGATGQMAFDATTNHFYVAQADSAAGGIWRLTWDEYTGRIVEGGKIVDTPDDLVTGLAVSYTGPPAYPGGAATGELNFTSKRTNTVRRVLAPASAAPTVVTVGFRRFSGEEEVGSIAADGNDLYLSEPFGVTKLTASPGATPRAQPVMDTGASFPGGVPAGIAFDHDARRLYAGTDNGNARDQIDVLDLDTGRHETYAVGAANVLAIAIETDGDLLVADDPADAVDADVNGQARIWRVPFAPLGRPGTSITVSPPTFVGAYEVKFDFTAAPGSTFECLFDDTPWEPCGAVGSGSFYKAGLAEGIHVFSVRAIDPDPAIGTGPEHRRAFVVDMTRPVVTIDNVKADQWPNDTSFTLRFSGNEPNLDYTCSVSGGPIQSCSPSTHTFRNLTPGWHTVTVTAIDPAGNQSLVTPDSTFVIRVPGEIPVPPADPPPPPRVADPPAPPLATAAVRRGQARLHAVRKRGCVRSPFELRVRGSSMRRVGFRLDGRRIALVTTPDARGRYVLRVPRRSAGRHTVTALVRFVAGAGPAERIRHDFTVCAKRGSQPKPNPGGRS